MSLIKCKRRFNKEDCLNLETLNDQDFNSILHSGYELEGFIKMFFKKEEAFSTMFSGIKPLILNTLPHSESLKIDWVAWINSSLVIAWFIKNIVEKASSFLKNILIKPSNS